MGGVGTVTVSGTPTAGQCAIWTDADTIEGVTCATLSGTPAAGDLSYWTSSTAQALVTSHAAGTVLTGAGTSAPVYTATPTLGASGTLGSLTMGNATSGTLTIQPATGALGTVTVSVPAATDTLVNLGSIQTLTSKTLTAPAINNQILASETVTAGTTQTQAGAQALSASVNVHLVTIGNDNDGVRLPTCDAAASGQVHYIVTQTANRGVRVYGAGTDTINSVATATGNKQSARIGLVPYFCVGASPGNWLSTLNFFGGTTNHVSVDNGAGGTTTLSLWTIAAPTLASGGCTSPTAVTNSAAAFAQQAVFSVGVGTSCSGSQPLVFTLPAATTGWNCTARNSTNAATSAPAHSSAVSTTSVTITNYARTTGLAAAWTDADNVVVTCARQ